MKIEIDQSVKAVPGDFGKFSKDCTLRVAPEYAAHFRSIGAVNVEVLYDRTVTDPGFVRSVFGWNEDELKAAIEELRSEIEKVKPSFTNAKLLPLSKYPIHGFRIVK